MHIAADDTKKGLTARTNWIVATQQFAAALWVVV